LTLSKNSQGSFTFSELTLIFETILQNNYTFVSFNEFRANKENQVLLRHDVDYDYKTALDLAFLEHDLKVKGTFFFMFTGQYNALTKDVQKVFKTIKELGHHLGLHYDSESNVTDYFTQNTIKSLLGEFDVYSNHRPFQHKDDQKPQYKGISSYSLFNTYDKQFSWDIKYVSDSNRSWFYGYPLEILKKLEGKNFQLLLHPIWWNLTPKRSKADCYQTLIEKIVLKWQKQFRFDEYEYRKVKDKKEKENR
jgi:hypothetical protein